MMERLQALWEALREGFSRIPWGRLWRPGLVVLGGVLIGLWLRLPVDAALTKASREMAAGSNFRLVFQEAGSALPLGAHLRGIEAAGPVTLRLDEATVRPRLSTLWFRPGVAVRASRGAGTLRGNFGTSLPTSVAFELDGVDLLEVGLGEALKMGIRLDGKLSGTGDLELGEEFPAAISGEAELELTNARILLPPNLPLPVTRITLRRVTAKLVGKGDVLELTNLAIDGDEVSGTIRGELQPRKPFNRSTVDLKIRVQFADDIEQAVSPFLPVAGFRRDGEFWNRDFTGSVLKLGG